MQVTDTTSTSGLYTKTVGNQELGKTEFLSLLVTQLKNQDPLQPMDNTEFVAQLAQFSNVEQLVSVNEGINILGMQQLSTSNAQAASLIGKDAEVKSDSLSVSDTDTEKSAAFTLEGDAADVKVNIRDSSGNLVRTIELGAKNKGQVDFTWDLKNDNGAESPAGTYRIDVAATDEEGNSVQSATKVRGTISGVTYKSGYAEIIVGNTTVQLSDIQSIYPKTEVSP